LNPASRENGANCVSGLMLKVLLSKLNLEASPKRVEDSSVFEIPPASSTFSVGVQIEESKNSSEVLSESVAMDSPSKLPNSSKSSSCTSSEVL
jgi:hypothetical protein